MAGPPILFQGGNHAARPAAGSGCVLYWCTDHKKTYISNGTAWSDLVDYALFSTATTRAALGLDTTDSPQFAGLNVGAATDTTITRTGAGDVAVEGNALYRAGGTDVPVADGGTGASTAAGARTNFGLALGTDIDARVMTTQDDLVVGGVAGAAARLGKGSDGQVLTVDPATHHLVWATPSSGFTNPMTTKGDVIVGDTGGSAIRKAVGSDGDVLTADAASTGGIKWAPPAAGGAGACVWLGRLTASASLTLDFTGFISSTYDAYEFRINGLVVGTTAVSLRMQMGTGGGPTYASTNEYDYGLLYSGIGDNPTQSTGSSTPAIDLTHSTSTQANFTTNGVVRLFNPAGTAGYKFIEGKIQSVVGAGSLYQWGNTGVFKSTTAVTAIRFLASAGTLASGTIDVFGYVHA